VPFLKSAAAPVLALAMAFTLGSMPLSAQASRRTAAPYGFHSFTQSIQLDPGTATGMVTDAAGNAYVAVNQGNSGYVAKVAPDGTVLYKAAGMPGNFGLGLAIGDNGSLWVGGVGKLDSHGLLTPVSFKMAADPIATDTSGNVYGVANGATGTTLAIKMDPSGNQIASFDTKIPASGTYFYDGNGGGPAIAVDSTGAVYVAGSIPSKIAFPTTPGAYRSATASAMPGDSNVYVFKVAPTLDRVVYAALIGGNGNNTATALAVDSAGEAIVGGSGEVGIANPFPLTDIGLTVSGDAMDAFVLKLSADGSSLVYSAGLGTGQPGFQQFGWGGSGSLVALAAAPDGSVQALVQFQAYGVAVMTIDASGDVITRGQIIPQPQPPPNNSGAGPVALAPGLDGSTRVLLTTISSGFPVTVTDETATPLLVDLAARPPTADLSIALTQLWPQLCDPTAGQCPDNVAMRVVVTNNGPDDAEGVQITVPGIQLQPSPTECLPDGVAVCQNPGVAIIPSLPAGTSMTIDFLNVESGNASVLAMTADANLANNTASFTPQTTNGNLLMLETDPVGFFYSNEKPGYDAVGQVSANPALSVWGPSPQAILGNLWYFTSWSDGNTDNPRVFDASKGIPLSQGVMMFRPTQPRSVEPSSLDFVIAPGVAAPASRSIAVWPATGSGYSSIKLGTPGASWVTLDALQMSGSTWTLTGSVNATGMAPGYYTTSVPVTLGAAGKPTVTTNVPISLRIASQPAAISPGGVVNAASYQVTSVASGEIITIFGSGLGPQQLVQATVPQAGSLPTSLAGTRVVFGTDSNPSNEVGAELLYVQDGSISAVVPYYLENATITVELGGAAAVSTAVPQGSHQAPGVFTLDQSGTGNAAAANADGTINSPQNPAQRGSMVLLYATGMVGSGCGLSENFGSNLLVPTPPVEISIGGEPALVLYSGSAPGMTCAVQQINVIIPEDSQTGPAIPLNLRVVYPGLLIAPAQSGLTLAIK
jgi:uncharacterized protein (TIGR03437 family)